ncbi:MAG TPA: DUF2267 domain-containing protein [Azospirillum sp.]|nr:DUF2267 domain-containing protein [Azospirillum sp.]
MSQERPEVLSRSVQETDLWLKELREDLHLENPKQAYGALRAVLHALRDRLTVDEAVHLSAQMPLMLVGVLFDGWRPAATPTNIRTREKFIACVKEHAHGHSEFDPAAATLGVFRLLERKIEPGQIRKILAQLPEDLRAFWQENRDTNTGRAA